MVLCSNCSYNVKFQARCKKIVKFDFNLVHIKLILCQWLRQPIRSLNFVIFMNWLDTYFLKSNLRKHFTNKTKLLISCNEMSSLL